MSGKPTRIFFVYAALLAIPSTAVYLTFASNTPSVEVRLREPLPTVSVVQEREDTSKNLQEMVRAAGGVCVYLTVISPSCPVCGKMRENWKEKRKQWETQTGATAELIWLTTSSLAEGSAFVGESDARSIPLLAFSDPVDGALTLGLTGTPTSFLVDDNGRLIKVVLGDVFPNDTATTSKCKKSN